MRNMMDAAKESARVVAVNELRSVCGRLLQTMAKLAISCISLNKTKCNYWLKTKTNMQNICGPLFLQ